VPIQTLTAGSLILTRTARRFAERANALDDPAYYGWSERSFDERTAIEQELVDCVLAAVVSSQAAVEASINELYTQGSINDTDHWFAGLDRTIAKKLRNAWPSLERVRFEEKIVQAARIAGFDSFKFGATAAQQLTKLIDLRNELMHSAPDWIELAGAGAQSADPLERSLCTSFSDARIWKGRVAVYRWDRCLGGPCAVWAYNTAVGFLREFFGGIGCGYPAADAKPLPAGSLPSGPVQRGT
jgi:hypothetical protein